MQDINYDEVLCGDVIAITFKGIKYDIQEPSLDVILNFERETAKLSDVSKAGGQEEVAGQIVRIIRTVYKDIPEEAFNGLPPKALYKMVADISSMVQESMLPEFVEVEKSKDKKTPTKKKSTIRR